MCEIVDWIMLLLLGICAWCDLRKKEIPLVMLLLMSAATLLFATVCPGALLWSRVGGGLIGILFFLISKATKQAIGYGDSWLILILGVHLGVSLVLQLLLLASMAAGLCSLVILFMRHWNKNVSIPFVPFMVIAYLGVMFL